MGKIITRKKPQTEQDLLNLFLLQIMDISIYLRQNLKDKITGFALSQRFRPSGGFNPIGKYEGDNNLMEKQNGRNPSAACNDDKF